MYFAQILTFPTSSNENYQSTSSRPAGYVKMQERSHAPRCPHGESSCAGGARVGNSGHTGFTQNLSGNLHEVWGGIQLLPALLQCCNWCCPNAAPMQEAVVRSVVETGEGSQQHFAGRSNPRKYQASFRNTKMSSLAASLWQGGRQGLCSAPCIPPPPPTPNIRAPPKDSILLERPHVFHSNELQPSCTKMRVAQSTLPRFITPIM